MLHYSVDLGKKQVFNFIIFSYRVWSIQNINNVLYFKETKSATMNIFEFFYFVFKSFIKVELSYVFTINLFTIAENCTE